MSANHTPTPWRVHSNFSDTVMAGRVGTGESIVKCYRSNINAVGDAARAWLAENPFGIAWEVN